MRASAQRCRSIPSPRPETSCSASVPAFWLQPSARRSSAFPRCGCRGSPLRCRRWPWLWRRRAGCCKLDSFLGFGVQPAKPSWFGYAVDVAVDYYLFALVMLIVAMWFVNNLRRSGFGRTLQAIRDNEDAARAFTIRSRDAQAADLRALRRGRRTRWRGHRPQPDAADRQLVPGRRQHRRRRDRGGRRSGPDRWPPARRTHHHRHPQLVVAQPLRGGDAGHRLAAGRGPAQGRARRDDRQGPRPLGRRRGTSCRHRRDAEPGWVLWAKRSRRWPARFVSRA